MPEAAVHEDARAVFGQHDVGSPGQCADTFAEPVSPVPQFTPDCLFGACVLRVYAGHAIVALFWCHTVRHGSMSVDYLSFGVGSKVFIPIYPYQLFLLETTRMVSIQS